MPFVTANGVRTFFESTGQGPPLLLIAGNGMDHSTFRDQLPQFSQHFRCITYDMRGVGQSGVPAEGYTVREMATDALDLLTTLGVKAAHVAGYSLGGAIGLEMALASPARVRTLSLYSTYSHVAPYLRRRYELLIKILTECSSEVLAMFTVFTAFGEEYINANDEELKREVAIRDARWRAADEKAKLGLLGHYRAILSHNALDRLAKISCPTWIAVGSSDPVTPPSYARLMHEKIVGSELAIYPGAPHRLLNFAAQFTEQALAFLLAHNEGVQ